MPLEPPGAPPRVHACAVPSVRLVVSCYPSSRRTYLAGRSMPRDPPSMQDLTWYGFEHERLRSGSLRKSLCHNAPCATGSHHEIAIVIHRYKPPFVATSEQGHKLNRLHRRRARVRQDPWLCDGQPERGSTAPVQELGGTTAAPASQALGHQSDLLPP